MDPPALPFPLLANEASQVGGSAVLHTRDRSTSATQQSGLERGTAPPPTATWAMLVLRTPRTLPTLVLRPSTCSSAQKVRT